MKIKDIRSLLDRASVNYGNDERIVQIMRRAREGEGITLGFIGGSITHGSLSSRQSNSYAAMVYDWFEQTFKPTPIHYKNAAIGGTDSVYGVHRMRTDLLIAKPDIVIVEFSVNDMDVDHVELAYEAMLVRLLMEPQKPGVIIVNTMFYSNGENRQDVHNKIALKYNLPIISVKNGLWDQIEAGKLKANLLTVDDLHPNDFGHQVMAEMIINQLEKMYVKSAKVKRQDVPSFQLTKDNNPFLKSSLLKNREIQPQILMGWQMDERQADYVGDMFSGGWFIEGCDGHMTFKIKARRVAIQYKRYVGSIGGKVKVRVDKEDQVLVLDGDFTGGWGDTVLSTEVVHEEESAEHLIEFIYNKAANEGRQFYVTAFMVAP